MNSQRITGYFIKLTGYGVLVLILLMTFSIIRNINKVGKIRTEVKKEREKIEAIKKENEELEKQVSEIQGVEFIERQLRDKLGFSREGETVVVLPDAEVLKNLAPKAYEEEDALSDPNWKKWLKLFL